MAGRRSGRRAAMSMMLSTPEGARRLFKRGVILFVIGLAITVGTYAYASSRSGGGTYIVSFGPMIFGAIYMIQGGVAILRHRSSPPVWDAGAGYPPAGAYGAPGGAPGYGAPPAWGATGGYGAGPDFGAATQPGYGQGASVSPAAGSAPGGSVAGGQAGWYPDPGGSPALRYYDGSAWTDHLHQG